MRKSPSAPVAAEASTSLPARTSIDEFAVVLPLSETTLPLVRKWPGALWRMLGSKATTDCWSGM